ncbi:MAG: hypothetical protein QGI10_06935 [Vicinamibacterales bacterium]|nr:hypothetical protein [Vicinamibacterales bacterium]MDP7478987.1 hypothetical protein [Vicinamibacterales bacterium]MDP7690444.1 hypothetical protein [Vicinamibacterales bacterium]HJN45178.1 hypothetical protein [Vicinamibacterales bacterium]
MTPSEIQSLVLGVLQAVGISSIFLLAVFLGFCVVVGFTKHRAIGKGSLVVRSLDDRLGTGARYLTPDVPRGPADQLKTPELLEHSGHQAS